MKRLKNLMLFLAFIGIGLFGSTVYATDVITTTSNVKVETVTKDDKKVEIIVSEDKYVRITQPTKVNTSTFESKMNVMGETSQGTEITIEVYNTSLDKKGISLVKNVTVYTVKTVGITETFNQFIELLEGENKIVLIYTNEKDKKNKEKMIFYVTRESEEKKEFIKTYNVFQDSKTPFK